MFMAVDPNAKRIVSRRRAMARLKKILDDEGLPYPPELVQYLTEHPSVD